MSLIRTVCLVLMALPLAVGCARKNVKNVKESPPVAQETYEAPKPVAPPPVVALPPKSDKGQKDLVAGVSSYENGRYSIAARQLRTALAEGLDAPGDVARAHKYLAFMHCVGGRMGPCRDEFRKALAADPAFELTPGEAGHPTWGPVFRKLKAAGKAPKK